MEDFEETKSLATDALHTLLVDGDARERVLAIWALALRSPAAMLMANQLRDEPDPGVRRALCVVLAGNGELDLVVAMARHDPNVHVRASAVQMVVRFAAADRAPWSLVMGRLTDAPEVRASVVSQIDATSPPELQAAVVACLRDPEQMVRREAFETCTKLVKAGMLGSETLVGALDRASDGERANALSVWFANERPEVICDVLLTTRREVRACALEIRPALVHGVLLPLYEGDDVLYEQLVRTMRVTLAQGSLRLVLGMAVRNPGHVALIRETAARLSTLVTISDELKPMLHALAASCERLLAAEAEEAAAEDAELALYDGDEDDEYAPEPVVERFFGLRDQIARLLL